jgi:hypothetical protein
MREDRGRDEAFAPLRRAESTGRPVGAAEFVTGDSLVSQTLGNYLADLTIAGLPT